MSIFEKIKQFFKNIGNKQKLLESPKELREEMSDISGVDSTKRSDFLEDIRFDPTDLLDPRICQGENLVPNILRTLGAHEDIVKNPRLIEVLEQHITDILHQKGKELPRYDKQPTRETINSIVETIKNNGILHNSNDIYGEHMTNDRDFYTGMRRTSYSGISIDPKTGAVTLQSLHWNDRLLDDYLVESTFEPDGNGNVIEDCSKYNTGSKYPYEKQLSTSNKTTYNSDGIVMKDIFKEYKQENNQDVLQFHSISTRDEEYPFIAQREIVVNERESGFPSPIGTGYYAIDMEDLSSLFPEYKRTAKGYKDYTSQITFENKEQVSAYYQKNKDTIDNSLTQEPKEPRIGALHYVGKNVRQSLKTGIKKLAVKAGILPNEHEHENENEITE